MIAKTWQDLGEIFTNVTGLAVSIIANDFDPMGEYSARILTGVFGVVSGTLPDPLDWCAMAEQYSFLTYIVTCEESE